MSLKLVPAALLLFVAVAVGFGQSFRSAEGTVVGGLVPTNTTVASGGVVQISIPVGGPDTTEATQVQVTGQSAPMSGSFSGFLVLIECTPACPGEPGKSGTSISVEADNLTEIVVGLQLNCTQHWTARVTADPGEIDETFVDITCEPPSGGAGSESDEHIVESAGIYQVKVSADPNLLPCEGGTTVITAELVDETGDVLEDIEFRFFTTAGTLTQTSPTTAKLTLGPNQYSARVSAYIPDTFDLENIQIDEAVTTVNLACNPDGDNQFLVVTASPNVIDCTGTTTITASVRDINGHVIPGKGFHFVTSAGLLTVDPNNANTEEGKATLKLRPGDGDATIIASSGGLVGTYEELRDAAFVDDEPNFEGDEIGFVTVQQNCLGTTTGQISVNSSAKTVSCGENVFIGLSVIDEDIQTVIYNTPLTLIASAGGFYGGVGEGGVQNLLPAAQVPTSHGEANTIYTAPMNFNGEVKITAASGDAYGFTKLNVTCVNVLPPSTGTGGGTAGGSAPPACVNIGDGVCITPPNTGRSMITPPNTGSAGLK